MENWIIDVMEDFGYTGILFLVALENVFPPIPSEVILLFGGYMTTRTALTVKGVIWFSTLGSMIGAIILFGIGRVMDAEKLQTFIGRWGHLLRLKSEDVGRANSWFQKYSVGTVFFCRFIPLIRSLISIPAGMSGMKFPLFLFLTGLGTFIWNAVLISLGAALGASWNRILTYLEVYSRVVYFGLLVLMMMGMVLWLKRR